MAQRKSNQVCLFKKKNGIFFNKETPEMVVDCLTDMSPKT